MLVKEVRSIFESCEGFEELEGWFKDNADQDFESFALSAYQSKLFWVATMLDLHQALEAYYEAEESALETYQESNGLAWEAYWEAEDKAWKEYEEGEDLETYGKASSLAWNACFEVQNQESETYEETETAAWRDLVQAIVAEVERRYAKM